MGVGVGYRFTRFYSFWRGLQPSNYLHQFHHGHRVHEVHTYKFTITIPIPIPIPIIVPITFSGRLVAAAIRDMEIDEVFDARMAFGSSTISSN